MELRVTILCILIKLNFIQSHEFAVKLEIPLGEIEVSSNISNETLKSALRYGFHRTHECQDYAKAYICIQKCIDLNYDIAYSNKKCACFCITKKEKAKYTPSQMFTRTKWKLGAPSTTRPAWVEKYKIKSEEKKAGKKLVDKITVKAESTKASINCTAANNSDSCKTHSNNTVDSNINSNENKFNDSNATSAVETPYKNKVNSSKIETPSENSDNSSAAETPSKNNENSTAVQMPPKNSDNTTLVKTPSKNNTNLSEVEDPFINSDNSAANMPSNNSSAVVNNNDNSTAVETPTKNNTNSSEVVDPHKSSSNSSEVEPAKTGVNASGVEPPQKNSANSSEVNGSSNNT